MWKELFSYFNCEIVVLNDIKEINDSEEKEIFEDIVCIFINSIKNLLFLNINNR